MGDWQIWVSSDESDPILVMKFQTYTSKSTQYSKYRVSKPGEEFGSAREAEGIAATRYHGKTIKTIN